jgi:hypothetical protein
VGKMPHHSIMVLKNALLHLQRPVDLARARQLASVAQLVRALHRNRRTTDSIPTIPRLWYVIAFFAAVPG